MKPWPLVSLAALWAAPHAPLYFEPNHGQADPHVRFIARGSGCLALLSGAEMVIWKGSPEQSVKMRFEGASAAPRVIARGQAQSHSNYFLGNDPKKWRTAIPHYSEVAFENVYPGIDVVYHGNSGTLEYDFVVKPGASADWIRIALEGAGRVRLDASGDLVVPASGGELRQHAPVSYQTANGSKREIPSRFAIDERGRIRIVVGEYDRATPLVIDPALSYVTYLGGSLSEKAYAVAVDSAGNAYVTGITLSSNFPVRPGAIQATRSRPADVFVTKFSPAGSMVYSTFLGGSGANDLAKGIAVDTAGNAYVTGYTDSNDFPVANALQRTNQGGVNALDGFVAKINAAGSALVYSTYLGGNLDDGLEAIAVDSAGNAYVTGVTESQEYPTTPGALQQRRKGLVNGTVTKISASGASLLFSTYIGGSRSDWPRAIALDAGGNVYITGETTSPDYPATPQSPQPQISGTQPDVFLTKINPQGTGIVYSTFVGGTGLESAGKVAVDAAGNAYITGVTDSGDFPATSGVIQRLRRGPLDAFVVKVNASGAAYSYATLLGGTGSEQGVGLAVDGDGNAFVSGLTTSRDFTLVAPFQEALNGPQDLYFAKLNSTATAILQSTYFGGSGAEEGGDIALYGSGVIWAAGTTASPDLKTSAASAQASYGGLGDAFAAKIDFTDTAIGLSVTPEKLEFQGVAGAAMPSQRLAVSIPTGARTAWTVEVSTASGGNWLETAVKAGTGPADVAVSVKAAGLQIGQYTGIITVVNQVTGARHPVPVTLTLTPPGGVIAENGVVNAASFLGGSVSPGMIVTAFGSAIGPPDLTGLQLTPAGLVSTVLAETRVLFDGIPAPLIYVSAAQASAIVPYGIAGKTSTQVQVEYRGVKSNSLRLRVVNFAPALFTANASGTGQGAILNEDTSYNSAGNAAERGSVVILYATGEGPTDPPGVDGLPARDVLPKPQAQVAVKIGGVAAELLYAGAAPGLVAGVMQVNVRVPAGVSSGDQPVVVTVGNASSQPGVTVAVK